MGVGAFFFSSRSSTSEVQRTAVFASLSLAFVRCTFVVRSLFVRCDNAAIVNESFHTVHIRIRVVELLGIFVPPWDQVLYITMVILLE